MDYEKNKEALAIVRQMIADGQISEDVAERYFPELRSREDEAIREVLIYHFEGIPNLHGIVRDQIIDWIKRHSEQKPHWKPSEEQISLLRDIAAGIIDPVAYGASLGVIINELEQLKAL